MKEDVRDKINIGEWMMLMTLALPDELAIRLGPLEDQIPQILVCYELNL